MNVLIISFSVRIPINDIYHQLPNKPTQEAEEKEKEKGEEEEEEEAAAAAAAAAAAEAKEERL